MKWWSKCTYMMIAKAAKMVEVAFEKQTAFVARGMGEEAFSLERESLDDLGRNADLCFHIFNFNHKVVQSFNLN